MLIKRPHVGQTVTVTVTWHACRWPCLAADLGLKIHHVVKQGVN